MLNFKVNLYRPKMPKITLPTKRLHPLSRRRLNTFLQPTFHPYFLYCKNYIKIPIPGWDNEPPLDTQRLRQLTHYFTSLICHSFSAHPTSPLENVGVEPGPSSHRVSTVYKLLLKLTFLPLFLQKMGKGLGHYSVPAAERPCSIHCSLLVHHMQISGT